MPTEHLIDNFNAVVKTINGLRPNRPGKFITRIHLTTPNSKEMFKLDPIDFPFEDLDRPGVESGKKPKKKGQTEVNFVRSYQLFRASE